MGPVHSNSLNDQLDRALTVFLAHKDLHRVASLKKSKEFFDLMYLVTDECLECFVNFNLLNNKGETALHCASRTNSEYVEILLGLGANPHIKNREGQTALHCAARVGSEKSVKFLLKAGVDVNLLDDKGRSALYEAVKRRSMPVVQLLMKEGANVNNTSSKNGGATMSLLSAALESKNMQMLDFVLRLDGDADVKTENPDGTYPLHLAVHRKIPSSIARYMIRQGADVNKQDRAGANALHHAVRWGSHEHVKVLVAEGADVSHRDRKGLSALHYAVLSVDSTANAIKTIEYLMKLGEKLSVTGKEGSTLLHKAATNPNSALLMFVLRHSAGHVDERNAAGRTALHQAASSGIDKNCELLLRLGGADVNAKCNNGRTPLFYAIQVKRSTSTAELLLQHGAELSEELLQRHLVRRRHESDLTRLLLRHLAKIHQSRDDLEIPENYWKLIERHAVLKDFFWASVREFERMGEMKLFEDITLQDIASKSRRVTLTGYARNEEMVKNYLEKYRKTKYPIFAKDLDRFKLQIVRQRLLARAANVFDGFRILNKEMNQKIVGFLGNDDLRYFLGDSLK